MTSPPPAWATIAEAFAASVRAHPERLALYDADERWTYAELDARSELRARALAARGVGAGDHVGVALARSLHQVTTMLAVFRLGAVVVPIDPGWPVARRAQIEADAELVLVITREASLGEVVVPRAGRSTSRGRAPAALLYTSGSTGSPKAVVLGHAALLWRLYALALAMPFAADDVACHRTSPTFVDALAEVLGPLLHGATVFVLPARFVVQDLVDALARERVTRLLLVPSLLGLVLDACPQLGSHAPALRLVATSGEPLSEALASRLHAAARGVRLVNIYGSTEVAGDATWGDVPDPVPDRITIGRPLAGVSVDVVDESGAPVADGGIGELVVAGPVLADGYWRRPELTAARFVRADGVTRFRTGDLARRLPVGELALAGRMDDQCKIAGVRIELGEIDRALAGHPAVRAGAAAVRRGPDGRDRLVAGVVGAVDLDDLRTHLSARLPSAAMPSVLVHLPALPLTGHGKLDRGALAVLIAASAEPGVAPPAVDDELTARIVAWFAELAQTTVAASDDFEAIGGDSLARLGLLVRLERAGFHCEHADLPRPLTALALAATLRALPSVPAASVTGGPDAPFALTDYQRVMVLDSLANRGTAMWVDHLAYTLHGELDLARFEQAWRDEAAAEPALRTVVDAERLEQVARPHVEVTVAQVDLRALDRERYRQRVHAEEWTRLSIAFELSTGPLFRVCVMSGPGDRHDLIFTYHHVILDGASARHVVRAVLARYAGRASARARAPFRELVMRPHATAATRWRDRFAGFAGGLPPESPTATGMGDLPWRLFHRLLALRAWLASWRVARRVRRMRPQLAAAGYEPTAYAGGELASGPLAQVLVRALRDWARRHHVTETAVWATLFALHLGRERCSDDVVFGVLTSARDGRSADAVGMLANCLPLRVRIDRAASLPALVASVAAGLAELERDARTPLLELPALTGLPARAFLDTLFISWAFADDDDAWSPPDGLAVRGGRGITMMAPHTALIVSPVELAAGSRAFHRADRIRRHVAALADRVLDGEVDVTTLLAVEPRDGGTSIAVTDLAVP